MNKPHDITLICPSNDLESETIIEIAQKIEGLDLRISTQGWGAKLRKEPEATFKNLRKKVWIIEMPDTEKEKELRGKGHEVKIIDHHNEEENRPSSIEQIAELFGIELDRWQRLVAANDKGYIPAMKCLCASEIEIKQIREADRKAQGVTEEDEKYAEEAIEKNKTEQNGIVIIKSITDKFSPIADRMYGKTDNLLIYTDTALTYYGERKNQIVKKYKNLVDDGKAYFGGGEYGFIGLADGKFSHEEINEIKNEIIEMEMEKSEKLYSHHIFIFPFKWKKWDTQDDETLKEKFEVKFFNEELEKHKWKREQFKLDYPDQYNEYNYFYDYVREILYDLGDELTTKEVDQNLINHFEFRLGTDTYYNIKLYSEAITYNLKIDSILLNVYSTGTAVLSFHLRNHKYPDKMDILKINKFGRRLYVPFLDLESDSIYTGNKDHTKDDQLLCATKKNEIPDKVWIGDRNPDSADLNLLEDFEKYKDKSNYIYGTFLLPKFIEGLFPKDFILINVQKGYLDKDQKTKDKRYKIHISPVLDDRMHVVCWYGNSKLVNELNQVKTCNDFELEKDYINDNREVKKHYSFETSEWWYCYIFNDSGMPMHTDRFKRQELLKENTYTRWVEWETLYGISRFSFVMLTSSFSDLEKNGVTFLVRHLQSMYYKMAELCLLQRATVLSFSNQVTHVSNLLNDNDEKTSIRKISELYKHYILFVNKIYFREVSAQEQGIEIYDMMQRIMRIPSDVKDLDNEIDELNRFASKIAEEKESIELKKHTKLATIFLPVIILAGILGMNTLPGELSEYLIDGKFYPPFWISIGIILLLTGIFTFIFKFFEKLSKKKYIKIIFTLTLIISGILLIIISFRF